MSILQLIIIALIQGITEWLPVSSSGHILLASSFFGFGARDELLISVMAHVGTLFAVLLYFWRDILRAVRGGFELVGRPFTDAPVTKDTKLAALILASIPAAVLIIFFSEVLLPDSAKAALRSVWTVAATTLVFGVALWWADVKGETSRTIDDMTLTQAALIGASQAVAAILPGTSRSGITMTLARWMGFDRVEAARFSMLIGAPILFASGAYAVLELVTAEAGDGLATLNDGLIVAGLSFISGYASIAFLMALLKRISFLPFVIYRIVLAIALILASPLALNWIQT